MHNKKYAWFTLPLLMIGIFSCQTIDLYEKQVSFSTQEWHSSNQPSFEFEITDTTAKYQIFVVIRHADAYRYNNIWLNVTTQSPTGENYKQQLELTLGDNTKGWLGTGMGDIFDHRVLITRSPIPLKKGKYRFTLQQTMRENPLQYVLQAGIRVEKIKV
ncbi:MAG: gliding motility lipoprotein GldH [Chitinophagaceae bacterium]